MGIGISVFLMAVGAILAFALNASVEGANLDTIGIILMIVGAVGLLAAIVIGGSWRGGRDTVVREREVL